MADELKPVYLLAGTDRPKIERAVQRLRARFGEDAFELHSVDEVGGDDVVAAANAMGLFSAGGRLIVVEGVETWKAPDAKAPAKNIGPSAVAVKTATPKPAVKAAKAPTHRVVAKAKRKAAAKKAPSKWAKAHSGKTIRPAASHAASGIAGQNSAASASTKRKPNPAIAKGQDHP